MVLMGADGFGLILTGLGCFLRIWIDFGWSWDGLGRV